MYFYYDGDTPIGFDFNDNHYYYITNLQGDIIAILDNAGECVAEYSYDAWGNCTIVSDTDGIAEINPLRYRGYYFDSDTGLYYLQSRYYDPQTGRFINADEPEMISQGVYNLFAYCEEDPINYSDSDGHKKIKLHVLTSKEHKKYANIVIKNIKEYFKSFKGTSVDSKLYTMNGKSDFKNKWNKIGSTDIVVIFNHTYSNYFQAGNSENFYISDISKLKNIKCKLLIHLGCNAGLLSVGTNVANTFAKK